MRIIDIDEKGRLTRLGDYALTPSEGIFRCVVQKGECWENTVYAAEQDWTLERTDSRITLSCSRLHAEDQDFDISVTLVIEEADGEVHFTGSIESRDEGTVTDVYYPSLGFVKKLYGEEAPELLMPLHCGCRYPNVGKTLTANIGREMEHQIALQYPGAKGGGGSMGYEILHDEKSYLYLGTHDDAFHASTLRAFGDREGLDAVGLEIDKMGFVRKGECWNIPLAVMKTGLGSWHEGAKRYREWANGWFDKRLPPEWVRRMNGYFLVINKQQFRKSCWKYDTLPDLYDTAQAHGLDCLGLFGWYETGHDNGYPDLVPAEDLGGEEGLKAGLAALHEKGGRATLYYQGNLIDIGSRFYQAHGREVEGKTRWGTPYIQCFDKALTSDYLRFFSGKYFSTACPGHPLWRECMTEKARLAKSYGADGVLYDQIGGMGACPCFDESHGHERPSLSYVSGRKLLMGDIRDQAVKNGPDFCFFSEHVTDVYAQYLDCLHGMYSNPGTESDGYKQFPQLFRYTFPECDVTVRNSRPYMTPRVVNYALTYKMKFEMELRYVSDRDYIVQDRTPEWTEYGGKAGALRRRHEDAMLLGTFRDTEGLKCDPRLRASCQQGEKETVAVLWNDTDAPLPLACTLSGRAPRCYDGPDGEIAGDTLAPQSVAVAVF